MQYIYMLQYNEGLMRTSTRQMSQCVGPLRSITQVLNCLTSS